MPENKYTPAEDLRGLGSLTIDAVTGIVDIVESMHSTITSFGGVLGKPEKARTKGITGFVYRSVHAVAEMIGSSMDVLLDKMGFLLGSKDSSPEREAVLSALNGVLGDYLVERNNSLAIPMRFRINGIPLDKEALNKRLANSNGRLMVVVHGSCMNDLQWTIKDRNHAESLCAELGYTPLYLHYNTGLHISENGSLFSDMLESIIQDLPEPKELVLLTHSMGGLVSRSAHYDATQKEYTWTKYLKKLIFLGTPHHGAPLEKGGNWVDVLLEINPYSAPFSRLGKIRSCGITDLRYGNITQADWIDRDRFMSPGDQRISVPLPKGVQCYAAAAITAAESGKAADGLIGDGLVTLDSAWGRHPEEKWNLNIPESRLWVGYSMSHFDLLHRKDVYAKVLEWFKE